jgi:hypothetical protein
MEGVRQAKNRSLRAALLGKRRRMARMVRGISVLASSSFGWLLVRGERTTVCVLDSNSRCLRVAVCVI